MIETIHPGNAIAGSPRTWDDTPIIAIDTPVMFEDEGQEEMGDAAPHSFVAHILFYGIAAHLKDKPVYQVYINLNLHYHPIKHTAYVSPDVMVVKPFERLPYEISSYRIGDDGPSPLLVTEVLSPRTAQQGDLTIKPAVYADSKIPEYLLVDPSGKFLKERLLIRRLQADGTWLDSQDEDGGVTSVLGFRVVIESDDQIRVINTATGERYARPTEAESMRREVEELKLKLEERDREMEKFRQLAVQKTQDLEAELKRLRKEASK
jgi:hypothetical protein